MLPPGCGGVPGEGQLRDRVDAVALSAPRSRRMARVVIVLLALVWTQFPFGGGGASAEGDHELALCCAWGRSLDDANLTYSIASPDVASGEVIRRAVEEWDADLPALTLSEGPVGTLAGIAIPLPPADRPTE